MNTLAHRNQMPNKNLLRTFRGVGVGKDLTTCYKGREGGSSSKMIKSCVTLFMTIFDLGQPQKILEIFNKFSKLEVSHFAASCSALNLNLYEVDLNA